MNLKNIFLFCLLFCTSSLLKATEYNSPDSGKSQSLLKDRIRFSLGGGLVVGTYTNISLMPQLGYQITDRWISGVGATILYYKNTINNIPGNYIYGGNVFTRYHLTTELFAQAEYQYMNFNERWSDYGLIGGGYTNGMAYISAYYALKQPSSGSIYPSPIVIRGGFFF